MCDVGSKLDRFSFIRALMVLAPVWISGNFDQDGSMLLQSKGGQNKPRARSSEWARIHSLYTSISAGTEALKALVQASGVIYLKALKLNFCRQNDGQQVQLFYVAYICIIVHPTALNFMSGRDRENIYIHNPAKRQEINQCAPPLHKTASEKLGKQKEKNAKARGKAAKEEKKCFKHVHVSIVFSEHQQNIHVLCLSSPTMVYACTTHTTAMQCKPYD